jgi:hypothetical protein
MMFFLKIMAAVQAGDHAGLTAAERTLRPELLAEIRVRRQDGEPAPGPDGTGFAAEAG